ncbi:alpha/beta hydrolase [Pigmentiphaga aceris]|uniref:Alpha/beta hydrolase n=1 Tax=Pigmentiphaga aceris TaxID=1940612 RepID=A0A5C0AWK2_9BURK|nr:alpha/beta hydrolase [Pigmentiphaga aceris]QEI04707.1 alpha/beta hydrolase [Pigmentiphaga aceris]
MRHLSLAAVFATSLLLTPTVIPVAQAADTAATGNRFSVQVEGQGPDVILVPGLGSGPAVWTATVAQLKATRRVHVIRVAGFAGEAPGANANGDIAAPLAEQLARYIDAGKLKSPAVIGHSLGGEVALMLAARHPDAVGRVMVVDALPFYSLLLDPTSTADSMKPRAAVFRDAMLAAPPEQAAAVQTATMARLIKTADARPAIVAAAQQSDRSVLARATYEIMTTDLRPELSRIRAPLTVVYAHDKAYGFSPAQVDANFRTVYAQAKTARFVRVDDSFHFVMIDQPKAFAQAVEAFLAN